jgi:hypothetical protein
MCQDAPHTKVALLRRISHHLSLGKYLEYHKISLKESVWIYQITCTGIKDGSTSMAALYVDSRTVCGFFLSW